MLTIGGAEDQTSSSSFSSSSTVFISILTLKSIKTLQKFFASFFIEQFLSITWICGVIWSWRLKQGWPIYNSWMQEKEREKTPSYASSLSMASKGVYPPWERKCFIFFGWSFAHCHRCCLQLHSPAPVGNSHCATVILMQSTEREWVIWHLHQHTSWLNLTMCAECKHHSYTGNRSDLARCLKTTPKLDIMKDQPCWIKMSLSGDVKLVKKSLISGFYYWCLKFIQLFTRHVLSSHEIQRKISLKT